MEKTLRDLGFDPYFQDRAADMRQSGHRFARVTAVDRGGGLVRSEDGEVPYELAGKLEYGALSGADLPCVGDWVCAQYHSSGAAAIVHSVIPRKTFLRRKTAGRDVDCQMIAANIDTAFVVQSCDRDFNLRRMERYLVMVREGGIEPVIVLTKTDLVTADELGREASAISDSGISVPVLLLSNETGEGQDEIRRRLVPGKTYCLLGSSGVGKTTLVNRLLGEEAFDTKPVSGSGEGVHTTARRQLVLLPQGAMVIDTPGMRELGILGTGEAVADGFDEIGELARRCRYADCSHMKEPGCSVLGALQSGALDRNRYDSFIKLKRESEFHEMSALDRRRKDRAFGKLIKSVKKHTKV